MLKRIIDSGVSSHTEGEVFDIRLINQVSLIGGLICVLLSVVMSFFEWYDYVLVNLFTFLFCGLIILANKFNKYFLARILFSAVLPSLMVVYIYFFGNIGAEYYLYIGAFLGIYFLRDNKIAGNLVFIFCGLAYVASKVILWKVHDQILFDSNQIIVFFVNTICSYLVIYAANRLFQKVNREEFERLERVSYSRGQLLSILSHDMRGPLRNLKLMLEQLEKNTFSQEEMKKIFGMISNQLEYTGQSMENTLMWVKEQLHGLQIEKTEFLLRDLVEESVYIHGNAIEKKDIAIQINIPKDQSVYTDRNMMATVVRNLLSNAVKHTFSGKGIVTIGLIEYPTYFEIYVKDNGQGMSKEQVMSLFNKISTTSGTQNEKGYGMGLFLVRDLLKMLDENINIHSVEGEGSTFSFTIKK